MAFKSIRDGISVLRTSCISDIGESVCTHLKNYYKSIDEPPYIIWIFHKEILPPTATIEQKDSPAGDRCHYNIRNMNRREAKRVFTNNFDLVRDGKICNNEHPRKFIDEDLKFLEP